MSKRVQGISFQIFFAWQGDIKALSGPSWLLTDTRLNCVHITHLYFWRNPEFVFPQIRRLSPIHSWYQFICAMVHSAQVHVVCFALLWTSVFAAVSAFKGTPVHWVSYLLSHTPMAPTHPWIPWNLKPNFQGPENPADLSWSLKTLEFMQCLEIMRSQPTWNRLFVKSALSGCCWKSAFLYLEQSQHVFSRSSDLY